ncbi:TPA: RepA leader peptide Tap [Kluyvera ascorbata F0526]|nr:RepA leader peptide Tap [Kluyvera ascorbata F0526]
MFGDEKRLTGSTTALQIPHRTVALCGEYSFMPGKLQYLLCVLLLCNISAGRRD